MMAQWINNRPVYPNELYHHGIKGMSWGVQNGPPYPLDRQVHNKVVKASKEERKAEKLAKKAEKAKAKQEAKQLKADTKLYNKTLKNLDYKADLMLGAYNRYRSLHPPKQGVVDLLALQLLTEATVYARAAEYYRKSVSANNVQSVHKNFEFSVETPVGWTGTINFNDLDNVHIK